MPEFDDGGPAFPRDTVMGWKGMSLRDWFAGQALKGILGNDGSLRSAYQACENTTIEPRDYLALMAYYQADAMLKAREE